VKSAEETKSVVDRELSDLQKTLKNIEEARAFDELTVVCAWREWWDSGQVLMRGQDEVAAAQPDIDKRTEQLVSKGRWAVPGYKVSLKPAFVDVAEQMANTLAGEVRRPLGALSVFLCFFKIPRSGLYYLRVNSFEVSMQS
jgi:hypothetical protein